MVTASMHKEEKGGYVVHPVQAKLQDWQFTTFCVNMTGEVNGSLAQQGVHMLPTAATKKQPFGLYCSLKM